MYSKRILTRRATFGLLLILICLALNLPSPASAGQSTITESDGYACMGDDKSRKATEAEAFSAAKRKAVEYVSTFVKSETQVKDFQLQKDLVEAYAHADVRIIQELEKGWYQDLKLGECFRVKIKAEVMPDEKSMTAAGASPALDDPTAPLQVRLWTDKKDYSKSEKIKIFLKGNKPFFARVHYEDASGNLIQLLPNPYRTNNYFEGGVLYEIPAGTDQYELEVSPPFGEERIVVYAGTAPLGEIDLKQAGGFYQVTTKSDQVGLKTRGVKLKEKTSQAGASSSEFCEVKAVVKTGR